LVGIFEFLLFFYLHFSSLIGFCESGTLQIIMNSRGYFSDLMVLEEFWQF